MTKKSKFTSRNKLNKSFKNTSFSKIYSATKTMYEILKSFDMTENLSN